MAGLADGVGEPVIQAIAGTALAYRESRAATLWERRPAAMRPGAQPQRRGHRGTASRRDAAPTAITVTVY